MKEYLLIRTNVASLKATSWTFATREKALKKVYEIVGERALYGIKNFVLYDNDTEEEINWTDALCTMNFYIYFSDMRLEMTTI